MTTVMPPTSRRGPSKSPAANAFLSGAVSILAMSSGLSLPWSCSSMSFGIFARAFTEPSNWLVAFSKPAARSPKGVCTSEAIRVSSATSAAASSPKARSLVATEGV